MYFPAYRPRRLRKNENFRRLIRETRLSVDNLIYPLFVVEGKGIKKPIESMPGNYQMSVDNLVKEVREAKSLGIPRCAPLRYPGEEGRCRLRGRRRKRRYRHP